MDEQLPVWERALKEARFLYIMWVFTALMVVVSFAALLPVMSTLWTIVWIGWVGWAFTATRKWGKRVDYVRAILKGKGQ